MPRSPASESTYPESTLGPQSPIFGTASFSTFTTTALTSLWPGSRRNQSESSSCLSDGASVLEHDNVETSSTVHGGSQPTASSHTYGQPSYSRSTSSLTERDYTYPSTSTLSSSYHVRSPTDPYTTSTQPSSVPSRTQSFSNNTFTPLSSQSHTRDVRSQSFSDQSQSTPTRHSASSAPYTSTLPSTIPSTLSSSQLQSHHASSTGSVSRRTAGELIALYEERAGRAASPHPFPAHMNQSLHARTLSAPSERPASPTKAPTVSTATLGMPGALSRSRGTPSTDSRSRSDAKSEVSAWSFGSGSGSNTQSQTRTRSRSPTSRTRSPTSRTRSGTSRTRSGTSPSARTRASSPGKSAASGWSYSSSGAGPSGGGGGGILGAISGFVGLSGSRTAYSASARTRSPSPRTHSRTGTSRTGSPSRTYARRRSRSTSLGRSAFSGARRARSRSGRSRSVSPERRVEESESTEELGEMGPLAHDNPDEPVYEAPVWYYNVHRLAHYTWERGHAQLFPHMLVVRWTEPSGLIAEVKLDLLSCVEIRTVRPSGAARDVRVEALREDGRVESVRLMTFELGYSDSLERLGAETRVEMGAWFDAIQTVFTGNMSLSSGSHQPDPEPESPYEETLSPADEPSEVASDVQIGSRSTIYISSSPRAGGAGLRAEVVQARSATPPLDVTVGSWRRRTQARSEVSTLESAAVTTHTTSSRPTATTSSHPTNTATDTFSSLASRPSARTLFDIGSGTGTDVVASTLSLRGTAERSLLGDSCHSLSSYDRSYSSFDRSYSSFDRGASGDRPASPSTVRAHETGQSRATLTQADFYSALQPQATGSQRHPPYPGTPYARAGDVSQDESDYATAPSPDASFVSLDPVEDLPGEDADAFFAAGATPPRSYSPGSRIGYYGAVWDGDQLLSRAGSDVGVSEVGGSERVASEVGAPTERGTEAPPGLAPPSEVEEEAEVVVEEEAEEVVQEEVEEEKPPTEVAPEKSIPEPDATASAAQVPLPPSVYTPSAVTSILPTGPPTESARSDALSSLSLSGPELTQLPGSHSDDASQNPEAMPTPAVLDAVSARLAGEVVPESMLGSEVSEHETEQEPEPEPEPEAEPEAEPEPEPAAEPEPEPEPQESEPAPEQGPEPEPAPQEEPAREPSEPADPVDAPKSPSVATSWGAETDGTYDSSVLHASPSLRSSGARSVLTHLDHSDAASSAPLVSPHSTSLGTQFTDDVAEEEEMEGARTPVGRAPSVSDAASSLDRSSSATTEDTESVWSSGPPSVPSNTMNTLSDQQRRGSLIASDAISSLSLASSILGRSVGEDASNVGVEEVEQKEYVEIAISPHMEGIMISRPPSTHSVSISAEPPVGHKGVGADNSKFDVEELSPRFKNLTTTFRMMLNEETQRLLSYFDERGALNEKGLDDVRGAQSELLALFRDAQAKPEKLPEAAKVDFATSPIMVARMEASTSPIPSEAVERSLSPILLTTYADAQMSTSPLAKKSHVRITLLSPPRKRAMTPESVVGSFLSSHHSDEASEVPAEGLSIERVWEEREEAASPLSPSSIMSDTASSSSRQTVIRAPPSRVSTRRRVSSPPATIPGFNGPELDDVSPADSVSSVGVDAPQPQVLEQSAEQRSILLAPVDESVHRSIQMPIPLRAVPFEGSLADFMENHVPPTDSEERTEVAQRIDTPAVEKHDQGTSPLVFEDDLPAPTPKQSTVVVESEVAESEVILPPEKAAIATSDKGTSPLVPPMEPVAESDIAEDDVLSTTEKAISPIVPPTEPAAESDIADDDIVSTTDKAISPMVPPTEPPQLEDDAASTTEKAVSPVVSASEPEPEVVALDMPPVKVEMGTSPLIFPVTPIPQEQELIEEELAPIQEALEEAAPEVVEEPAAEPVEDVQVEPVEEAQPIEMVEVGISPIVPTPVLADGDEDAALEDEDEEEDEVSPATTVKPLPAKVDVACETEVPVEAPTPEPAVEVPISPEDEPVEEAPVPEPVVEVQTPVEDEPVEEAPLPVAEVEVEPEASEPAADSEPLEEPVPQPDVTDDASPEIAEEEAVTSPTIEPAPELVRDIVSPPDSPAPATPQLSSTKDLVVLLEELRKSREESQHFKEKWEQAQGRWDEAQGKWDQVQGKWEQVQGKWEQVQGKWDQVQDDEGRYRQASITVQMELSAKVDKMMDLFESFSKQDFATKYSGAIPSVQSLPPGFVPQPQAQTPWWYHPQTGQLYPVMSAISPAQVPIPPTPGQPVVVPAMPSSSGSSSSLSSRSSTPSTLRTTTDLPLPSLDMPHLYSTFPAPQPQLPISMDEVIPSPPVFHMPPVQMPTPVVHVVMPEPVIPPTLSDTSFRPETRSVDIRDVPLPADFEFPPASEAASVEPAAATPRPATPAPVIPPEPSPVSQPREIILALPVEAAAEMPATPGPSEDVTRPEDVRDAMPEPPVLPADVDVTPESDSLSDTDTPRPSHVALEAPAEVAPTFADGLPQSAPNTVKARAIDLDEEVDAETEAPANVPSSAVIVPSALPGSPHRVPLPPSPSRSSLGDGEAISQQIWDAANDLRLAVQTTLSAAQGAEAYSRQAQEILGIVRTQGAECTRQLEECIRLRDAARVDKEEAQADRLQAQTLREEAAAERVRDISEREAKIEQLEQELAELHAQVEEQKQLHETADAEREATRATADAEREARIQVLEEELASVRAEREQEKEARAMEDAERQAEAEEKEKTMLALAEAKAEADARIAALEEEKSSAIAALEEEKSSAIATLEEAKTSAIAALEEESALAVAALKEEKAIAVAALEEENALAAAALATLEEEKAAIITELEEKAAAFATLEEEKSTALLALEEDKSAALAALEEEKSAALAALEEEKSAAFAALEEDKAAALAALEEDKAAALAALEDEKTAAIAAIEEDKAASIAHLEEEHTAALALLEEEKTSIAAEYEQAKQDHEAIIAEFEQTKQEHEAMIAERDEEKERIQEEARAELERITNELEQRVQEKEEAISSLLAQHEEASQRCAEEQAERAQAAADREHELLETVAAGEARVQTLEEELASLNATLEQEKEAYATSLAEREVVHSADMEAKDAEAAERERALSEQITALEEELCAARAAYMVEHERLVNEHTSHQASWEEREQAFAETEEELKARVSTLEGELEISQQQHREAQQSLADATAAHEDRVATLEGDLTAAQDRHAELEQSLGDITAAHEERVTALEDELASTQTERDNAQVALDEYAEKEAAWTEREAGLLSTAEERDARIQTLEDELASLREEQEQERQRRVAEDGERAERERIAVEASLDRERTIAESHDARIKELTEELAALRAEREQERAKREVEDAERREADKAEAKEAAEAHTVQLTAIEEKLAQFHEHSTEQFTQQEIRVQEVTVRLDRIEDTATQRWEQLEAEKAEAAAKPTMETILDGHRDELRATMQGQLEALENGLKEDGIQKQDEILAQIRGMIEEHTSAAITSCVSEFSTMLESLSSSQQAEILSALRIAIQEQVTLNISFYIEELSKTWDAHGARLLEEVLTTVRSTEHDVVEFNTDNHLTDFCKNLAPEMLQLFHEIREKEEEKQKLDRQIDILRRHKTDYETEDLGPSDSTPEEVPMKGAWRGRSSARRRAADPQSHPLPVPPEQLYPSPPPPPMSHRGAPSYHDPSRPVSSWGSWPADSVNQPTDPSVQLAMIPPPVHHSEYGGSQATYYHQ
ncbi:hypothetical protein PsYK624_128280 [Phanerochaete sordida]|uniref:PH domain-containing protein n=1 Tax=Phanerochaete sordida TaxID=48140 RepID=A0A9P3LIX5_9APHY|nr:hypothetical protein PsYK624_128280 [Phanerochaete sordida]